MGAPLFESLHPAAGALAKRRLQIPILPDCAQHEAYALGLVANEQQDTVADHAMAQQGRSVVEEHQIEPIARDLSTERTRQAPDRVRVQCGIRRVPSPSSIAMSTSLSLRAPSFRAAKRDMPRNRRPGGMRTGRKGGQRLFHRRIRSRTPSIEYVDTTAV